MSERILFFILLTGCAQKQVIKEIQYVPADYVRVGRCDVIETTYENVLMSKEETTECLDQQTDLYNDLCAESSTGYEYKQGSEAHFDGVECAVQSIKACMGIEVLK